MKIPKAQIKQSEVKRNLTYVTTQHGYQINDHFSDTSVTPLQLGGAILMAAVLLFITFFFTPFNFWFDMVVTLAILVFLAFAWSDISISRRDFNLESIILGIGCGILLYLLCYVGYKILGLFWAPAINAYAVSLYAMAHSVPLAVGIILIIFLIVPGEEIFWRGFVQRNLQVYLGNNLGIALAVVIYALAHIWAFNPLLILAAIVGGACWGILYAWRSNLVTVILAHIIWCVLIVGVFPLV